MAPGGEMFRYPQHFGENVLPRGSHEWLPYSVDEVRFKSSNTNLSNGRVKPISTLIIILPVMTQSLSIVQLSIEFYRIYSNSRS